jgi:cytochrome c oxidase assembly protein subunit 15
VDAVASPKLAGLATADRLRPVRLWLWMVAALVFAMVVVGGATRLTGSGLSITEWNPVSGALPPFGVAAWQELFAKYQASPQYQLLNHGMSLASFKFIFWWEWGHRQLGRFIGLVYLAGFVAVVLTRRVDRRTGVILLLMGLLLGMQGAVGWIMVASGLKPGMTAVAPVKLALHLTLASLFFASLVFMATRLAPQRAGQGARALRSQARLLCGLVLLQIALGGLVAGSHAGLIYNTWPLMDGALVPSKATLFFNEPWFENFVDNTALVQFNHRLIAYLVFAVALWHAIAAGRRAAGTAAARRARVVFGLILVQVALGIATLLLVVPLHLALTHQAFAILLLGMAVAHVAALARDETSSVSPN